MFLENTINPVKRRGWIEVICGAMFSGKTEELIRRLKRAQIAKQKVEVVKPVTDTRYDAEKVVTHTAAALASTPLPSSEHLLLFLSSDVEVVGIDEAQFFDMNLVRVCNQLAANGIRVIVAGLDMNYLGEPFGPMPGLLATAEYVTKVHAICMGCGNLANHSYRTSADTGVVLLGATESYQPLCRACFNENRH